MSFTDGQPLPVGPQASGIAATCGPTHSVMACGIHLKQLKSADLHAIGVPGDRLGGTADDENGQPFGQLAEADPVLAQTLTEVRQGLEAMLSLLDEALAANPSRNSDLSIMQGVGCGERGMP